MSGELDESIEEHISNTLVRKINEEIKNLKNSLIDILRSERKSKIQIINKIIMDLKSLESSVETITEKGTNHVGQYIQIDIFYELIEEYKEKLKQLK